MNNQLYRKLYIYAFTILITAIVLTIIVMGIIFRFTQQGLFKEHFINEGTFIRNELHQAYQKNLPALKKRMEELSKELNWSITYWQENQLLYTSGHEMEQRHSFMLNRLKRRVRKLHAEHKHFITYEHSLPPYLLMYLDKQNKRSGYLIMKYNVPHLNPHRISPFILSNLILLLFLAILLIPYSKYILSPYKKLMASIERVAAGDFSQEIDLPAKGEFREMAQAFNNMTRKIQIMIKEKQQLIADVSHELRSPLTRMRMSLEILAKDPEGRKKYLDKAINEIENLDKMIENLLNISKLELSDKLQLEKIDFSLFLKEIIEKHQVIWTEQKLRSKTSIPSEVFFIKGDKNLLEQVLNNIFSNAGKYAPENSEIEITLVKENEKLTLSIRDFGPGVPETELDKIFEPFLRLDNSRSRKTGGTGLGLAISRKIIDSLNGKIWAGIPSDNAGGLIVYIVLDLIS